MNWKKYIDNIPNFPKEGIIYRDIQPILENRFIFSSVINELKNLINIKPDYWVGVESRGFIFASAIAHKNGDGFKMIRKRGKLPNENLAMKRYELEYGSDWIEMKRGQGDVIIVDDVYATGGTMSAAEQLCIEAGYNVVGKICLVDIGLIKDHNVRCLITYNEQE